MVTDRANKGEKIWFDDDYSVVFSLKSHDIQGNEVASVASYECKLGSKTLLPVINKAIRTMSRGETATIQVDERHSSSGGHPVIAPSSTPVTLSLTLEDAWKVCTRLRAPPLSYRDACCRRKISHLGGRRARSLSSNLLSKEVAGRNRPIPAA